MTLKIDPLKIIDNNFIFLYKKIEKSNLYAMNSKLNFHILKRLLLMEQSWNNVVHLASRNLRILRRNGKVDDFWQLDTERKQLVPLKDHNGNITGYGVWLWAYMNREYPHELKIRSISELLKLNP